MTVKELRDALSQFGDDEPVWVYIPDDENEPYHEVDLVERWVFGEITIYYKQSD